jgi:hypothetical protein
MALALLALSIDCGDAGRPRRQRVRSHRRLRKDNAVEYSPGATTLMVMDAQNDGSASRLEGLSHAHD